jgi:Tol biopolymer transport system component
VIIAPPDSTHEFFHPDLSPDGSKVVFVDCDPGNHHPGSACGLAVANIDGSGYRALGGHQSPRWSPDGKRIAAIRYESDGRVHIVSVMNADGSNRRDLAYVHSDSLDWSADGLSIVFGDWKNPDDRTAGSALFSLPVDGPGSRRQLGPDGNYNHPTWSPDGTQIAFIRNFTRAGQDLSAVAIMNADGTGLRDVSAAVSQSGLGRPAWAPDSRSLAFSTYAWGPDGQANTPLDIYNLVDGTVRRVMDGGGGGVSWGNPTGTQSCDSGYWLVASDGGIFAFGDAPALGSAASPGLPGPVVGVSASPSAISVLVAGADGTIIPFGHARFCGSLSGTTPTQAIVGVAATPER